MKELIMTKGLPASGKSTWAKETMKVFPNVYKRVNKDDLRAMLDDGNWTPRNEKLILKVRDTLIRQALDNGFSVIVDDTNLAPKHEVALKEIAREKKIRFQIEDFTNVPVQECIRRDLIREASVGAKVIRDMYNKYLAAPSEVKTIEWNPDLPNCWIFDIDGTLALKGDRSPYDWKRVGEDKINRPVAYIQILLSDMSEHTMFIFSGRDSVCRPETIKWLRKNRIHFDQLFMRAENDSRKDSIVKQELYEKHIKDKYNVLGIFDDRNQVVEMWRSLGLTCFQVADGNF